MEAVALQLIEELGNGAGHCVGAFARSPSLEPTIRQRLLAIADEIQRHQGISWYFPDGPQRA